MDIVDHKLKELEKSLGSIEEHEESDRAKIDEILDSSTYVRKSPLSIDPTILSRIDEIDLQLAKLKSMRLQEEEKNRMQMKRMKGIQDQMSNIDSNLENMKEIMDKIDKSMDESDELRKTEETAINDNFEDSLDED